LTDRKSLLVALVVSGAHLVAPGEEMKSDCCD
jgi:hypothetical protein